jgi:hypothetical protein
MARKSDRELVSFRLDPELSAFLRDQARLQGVSLTELVNRLLRWAVQSLPTSPSQGATVPSAPQQHSLPSTPGFRTIPAYSQLLAPHSTPHYSFSSVTSQSSNIPTPPSQLAPTEPSREESQVLSLMSDVDGIKRRMEDMEKLVRKYFQEPREQPNEQGKELAMT